MKKKLTISGACFALFAILILLVRTLDVAAIGPAGTGIGLSRLNAAVHRLTGVHLSLYELTEALGLLAILIAACFGLLGLVQLLRGRSLRKVDPRILALGALYGLVIACYLFFEFVIVNYRPVLMPGAELPEASFPSSHTTLSCVVLGSAALLTGRYIQSPALRRTLRALCWLLMALTVVGRLLSGVHWLTDILGGLLLSGALVALYAAVVEALDAKEANMKK